ncbi:UDP-N-acetylmuramate dehydrogenase [Agaribacterium sp. ZY112]|uniref:UDP-N-acetylmuramate dehydrogenase n=1 Tax=Agaribacterium sp. ZY112 TaxID=3233574 RepID=UPI0035243199
MPCIEQNVSLQPYSCLALPSTAAYFCRCQTEQDVLDALAWAKERGIEVSLLGGGSNALLEDHIDALVIKLELQGRKLLDENEQGKLIRAAAGESWHEFVLWTLEQGWPGLENLSLIPGTVGAAPIQNIGAYGVEVGDLISSVHGFDLLDGSRFELSAKQCAFDYRDSVFKQQDQARYLISAVDFFLPNTHSLSLHYPALADYLAPLKESGADISATDIAHAVIAVRNSKLPAPEMIPNLGSFFKNPVVDAKTQQRLINKWPDLVSYALEDGRFKLAAGWLIDKAGWKGREYGGVRMHDQQALVLSNPKRQTLAAVLACATQVSTDIQAMFDVELEREPQLLKRIKL